jgi:ABC-type dipeptide/oligopeptide/nickel transport system permease subunit
VTTLVLIYLAIVAFCSFLEWAVKGKCQTFVFFTVVGSFCALGFIGVGVAFALGMLEMLFDASFTFTSQDWWWIAVLIVSVVSGMAWATHVTHREFRPRRRTQC